MNPQRTLSNDPQCVYRNLKELIDVLDRYREWMRQGLNISAEIARVRFHNGGAR